MLYVKLAIVAGLFFALQGSLSAAEPKKDDKDPLAKFSDEDLIKIDFCFNKFCESIASKDARTAAALIEKLPANLARLDLNKEADKAEFVKAFASMSGCSASASQRMAGGLGQITYSDSTGAEKTQRMQNVGGRWKLVLQ
jgi:hypothetical protein